MTAVSLGHFPGSHPAHSPQNTHPAKNAASSVHSHTGPHHLRPFMENSRSGIDASGIPWPSLAFTSPLPSHPHFFLPLPGLLWEPYLILNSSQKVHNISNWRGLETSSPIFFSCRKGNWGLKRLKNLPKSCDFWIRTCRGSGTSCPKISHFGMQITSFKAQKTQEEPLTFSLNYLEKFR